MKLNFAVFKKGKPIYWILGAIAIFVFFYWILFRASGSTSSGASGGTTVVQSGPSDAAIAANTQLAMAQLQYGAATSAQQSSDNANVAVATLAAQANIAQTQAGADVAKYTATLAAQTTQAGYAAQQQALSTQVAGSIAQTQIQAQYGVDTARIAAQSVYDQANIQSQMFGKQLDAQTTMFASAQKAAVLQSLAAQIPSVLPVDRDNMLAFIGASASGQGLNFTDAGFTRGIGSSYTLLPNGSASTH